jgi:hypothetical protein
MDRRSWCIRALTAILLASSLAYSSLGWCPPPPGSPLLPNGLILDFGMVAQSQTGRRTISYPVNPQALPSGFISGRLGQLRLLGKTAGCA